MLQSTQVRPISTVAFASRMSALPADELAARAQALAERVDADPPTTWRPNDPDKAHPRLLVGEFVRLAEGHTSYGPARIVVLRDGEGRDWSIWLLHAVLKQEFAKLRPRPGELVAVKWNGHVEPRDGRAGYESYTVAVDRDAGAVDWGFAGEVEPAATPAGATVCEQCGFAEPAHASGCPNDDDSVPF
jgi:hypothetical protein